MKSFIGLLVSSIMVLLGVMYIISNPAYLSDLKPIIRFIWTSVTPVSAMCAATMNQVASLVDQEDMKSTEHTKLASVVKKYLIKLWTLQGFYIFSSIYVLGVTFIPLSDHRISVILVSIGVTLIWMSLFTYFKLRSINQEVISFKARLKNRKIRNSEISDALDKLDKEDSYSEEDKEYFENHNKVITVKQSKNNR